LKIKFVNEADIMGRGRKSQYPFAEFIEELYKFPNQWAEFPEQVNFASQAYRVLEKYADIEVVCKGGNPLAKNHPDKKNWTVYIRYTPKDETF
jgi:hypothetical protein